MNKVYLGIGSNIGNRLDHLQEAVDRLGLLKSTTVKSVSSIYMTEPVGETEQDRFYNGVILLETSLPPEELRRRARLLSRNLDALMRIHDGVQES